MKSMTCDACGLSVEDRNYVNWFELDRIGITAITIGDEGGPWHFCSVACVGRWAAKHFPVHVGPVGPATDHNSAGTEG